MASAPVPTASTASHSVSIHDLMAFMGVTDKDKVPTAHWAKALLKLTNGEPWSEEEAAPVIITTEMVVNRVLATHGMEAVDQLPTAQWGPLLAKAKTELESEAAPVLPAPVVDQKDLIPEVMDLVFTFADPSGGGDKDTNVVASVGHCPADNKFYLLGVSSGKITTPGKLIVLHLKNTLKNWVDKGALVHLYVNCSSSWFGARETLLAAMGLCSAAQPIEVSAAYAAASVTGLTAALANGCFIGYDAALVNMKDVYLDCVAFAYRCGTDYMHSLTQSPPAPPEEKKTTPLKIPTWMRGLYTFVTTSAVGGRDGVNTICTVGHCPVDGRLYLVAATQDEHVHDNKPLVIHHLQNHIKQWITEDCVDMRVFAESNHDSVQTGLLGEEVKKAIKCKFDSFVVTQRVKEVAYSGMQLALTTGQLIECGQFGAFDFLKPDTSLLTPRMTELLRCASYAYYCANQHVPR